jgi:hypothetical protein
MFSRNPLWSPVSILIVALALSIGWGIRGNYGHELGAMLPGALAAIAACVLSGREDWRGRVAYFALFGALGWGFGGSISYMQVIGYTHTNHFEPGHEFDFFHDSTLYGFLGLFAIGFLWAAVGGGATALPAWLDRQRLADLVLSFVPLFALWVVIYLMEIDAIKPGEMVAGIQNAVASSVVAQADAAHPAEPRIEPSRMARHEEPLYWFDSDWINVSIILVGTLLFDLATRRGRGIFLLLLLAAAGAGLGFGGQYLCEKMGWTEEILRRVVHLQGDPEKFPVEQLMTNWPRFITDHPTHIGWVGGLVLGILAFFSIFGRFPFGSLLYFYLAVGWFVGFLGLTVLGNLHMTPPRGDSWAGITGMLIAGWIYFLRERWTGPLLASLACGAVGGLGFAGTAWIKLCLVSWGNPALTTDPEVVAAWSHFQHANWHSFLEQTYGFINGIGVVVALALLVRRAPLVDETGPRRRWTEIFALFFVLPVLIYTNMAKNLNGLVYLYGSVDGQGGHQPVPSYMTAPLVSYLRLSAWGWYSLFFAIITIGFLVVAAAGARRKIDMIPDSWTGRGQLLFFVLCWVFVLGNIVKSLPEFNEQRLITEGATFIHAVLATVLLLTLTPVGGQIVLADKPRWAWAFAFTILLAISTTAGLPFAMTKHVRHIYGNKSAGHSGVNIRWGENANWRVSPNLRGVPHR